MLRLAFAAVLVGAILTIAVGEELYSDKYDHMDPNKILVDDALRDQYYACFMGTGSCVTDDAKFFKQHFTEAVVTRCKKCTEKQKENFAVLLEWYTENRPDEWKALMTKTLEEAKAANMALD